MCHNDALALPARCAVTLQYPYAPCKQCSSADNVISTRFNHLHRLLPSVVAAYKGALKALLAGVM